MAQAPANTSVSSCSSPGVGPGLMNRPSAPGRCPCRPRPGPPACARYDGADLIAFWLESLSWLLPAVAGIVWISPPGASTGHRFRRAKRAHVREGCGADRPLVFGGAWPAVARGARARCCPWRPARCCPWRPDPLLPVAPGPLLPVAPGRCCPWRPRRTRPARAASRTPWRSRHPQH